MTWRIKKYLALVIFASVLMLAFSLPSAAFAGINVWTPNGPSGTLSGFAFSNQDPATMYSGSDGVYKTINEGLSWTKLTNAPSGGHIEVDPFDDMVFYLEAYPNIYKTYDGGNSWQTLPFLSYSTTFQVLIDPSNGQNVYVIKYGGALPNLVYKSTNGGLSFTLILNEAVDNGAIDPVFSNVLYVGGSVLKKSTDGGNTWIARDTGLPAGYYIKQILIDKSNSAHVWVLLYNGLYESNDSANSWTKISTLQPASNSIKIYQDAFNPAILYLPFFDYLGSQNGLYRSTDAGRTWSIINNSISNQENGIRDISINPLNGKLWTTIPNDAVWQSDNGGFDFVEKPTGINNISFAWGDSQPMYRNPNNPDIIWLMRRARSFKSNDGGITWNVIPFFENKSVSGITIDPNNSNKIFVTMAGGSGGGGAYVSSDGGTTWAHTSYNGWSWHSAAISPANGNIVLAGGNANGIQRSIDGGNTWTTVYYYSYTDPYKIVFDPRNPSIVYASIGYTYGNPGLVKSYDSGATWTDISGGALTLGTQDIVIDPNDSNTLYVMGTSGSGEVHKSVDGGASWAKLNVYPGHLAIDESAVYVGQYRSFDGGLTWERFGNNSVGSRPFLNPADPQTVWLVDPGVWTFTFGPIMTTLTTNPATPNGANNWFKTAPLVNLTRNKPGYTNMQFADTTPTLSDPDWVTADTTTAPEGVNTLYYYSVDTANNTETIQSLEFKVDPSAPTIFTQNLPAADATINKPYPYFSWNDSSDTISGLDKYELYIDGALQRETSSSVTSAVPSSALSNGAHIWFVRAWDAAGNYRDSAIRNITVSSGTGEIVFTRSASGSSQDEEIYVVNSNGGNERRLTNNLVPDYEPVMSPDGTKIAFNSSRDGDDEIYIMNTDGNNITRLTNNLGYDRYPSFSPDGSKVIFVSDRDKNIIPGNYTLYTMNIDGTNVKRLIDNPWAAFYPSFSPDGNRIIFQYDTTPGTVRDIYVMNADGTNQIRLTNDAPGNYRPLYSPDGANIFYYSSRWDGNVEVFSMTSDGLNKTNLTNNVAGDAYPSPSPDGTKLVMTSNRDGRGALYVINSNGSGLPSRLTFSSASEYAPSWGPSAPIDITPPTTTFNTNPISPNGTNLWYKTKPGATLSRDEPGISYYQWDSTSPGGWQVADSFFDVFTELQTEGQHTLNYYSVDTANNTETVKSQLFKIDSGTPATSSLSGSAVSATQIDLSWTPASDLVSGLAGYKIYNANTNAELATKASGIVSHSFSGLQSNTTYRYYLKAFDAAGNLSGQSNTLTITTPVGVDTTPPSTPSLSGYADDGKAMLSWSAASDNVGVSGYKIYDANTLLEIAATAATSYSVEGLIPDMYQFYVKAFDGANNYSTPSNTVAITVPSHEASETIDGGVGGDVETPDHKAHIHLPPNAKPGSILITISRNDDSFPPIGGKNKNSSVYIFGPDGTTFDTPVTITLAYEPSADPNLIDVHWYNPVSGAWEIVTTGKTINRVAHTISVTVTHFSTYTVLSGSPATGVNTYVELIVGLLSLLFGFMMIRNSYKRY